MAGKTPSKGTPKDKRLAGRGMKPGPKPMTPKKNCK